MRSIIYVQLVTGEIIRAFTWLGFPELGICRAKQEANQIYGPVAKAWSIPLENFE